ncbi:MAG: FAD-dependent oxidoreductase [Pseudomonadota bacterium]
MTDLPLTVAVIGAGPAGLFALDALLRQAPNARVDVYERLPTPFGLIRTGVAPDHQGTKAVVRQFDRAFAQDRVRLIADCEVGQAVPLTLVADAYDLVFLATGAPRPRRLGLPGEELPGVYSASILSAWMNGHPDHSDLQPRLGERVVIVGGGNVALDMARVLAKTPEEMAASDICAHARPLCGVRRSITVAVRARADATRFSAAEVAALARLQGCGVAAELAADLDPASPVVAVLEAFAATPSSGAAHLRFRFDLAPVEIVGRSRVEAIRVRRGDGGEEAIPTDNVISAIGHESAPAPASPRTYAVGWASGGRGDIPSSRAEAAATVRAALVEAAAEPRAEARARLAAAVTAAATPIDWRGWKQIDAAEIAAAEPPRPREKLVTWRDLREVAGSRDTKFM